MAKSMSPRSALLRAVREDANWQRYQGILTSASERADFDKYPGELQALHGSRSIRVLGIQSAPSGKKIADASMKDQATRSRCVEIIMEVLITKNHLAATVNTVHQHLLAEFGTFLGEHGVRSMGDRRDIVESLFGKAQRKLETFETIIELADLVIKDVDQASWSIKSTVTALEIATAREKS